MHGNEVILDVADQAVSRQFDVDVLGTQPALDVPGMTELDLVLAAAPPPPSPRGR